MARLLSFILVAAVTLMLILSAGPARAGDVPAGPVKVFILAGQSNMEGHGKVEEGRDPNDPKREIVGGLGSLRRFVNDNPGLYGADGKCPLVDKQGKWLLRDDVWVWATTDKGEHGRLTPHFGANDWIGPEYGFGVVVGNALDCPVLIIKTSWGGKSLGVDFRSPSSGNAPYKNTDPKTVGFYYREMLGHVRDVMTNVGKYFPELAGRKLELAGFGWHQGWNDGCSADMTAEYEKNMANFIRDVRKDLGAAGMPFVIGGSGFNGKKSTGARLAVLEAQLAMADVGKHLEFKGNVAAVDTRGFWRDPAHSPSNFGYHWNHNGETHFLIGQSMGAAMMELLKGKAAPAVGGVK